jgi:two-component system response regulator PilR (NtrC family)
MQTKKLYSAHILQSLLASRVCVLAIALLVASTYASFYRHEIPTSIYNYRYLALAIFFAFTALSCLWYIWRGSTQKFILLQFAADILLASALVYFSGAAKSPFLFLYLILVLSSALLAGFRAAIFTIFACLSGFIAVQVGINQVTNSDITIFGKSEFLIELFGLTIGMLAAALAPRILKKHLALTQQAVLDSESKLKSANLQQNNLLNQLPFAVVTSDQFGMITHINRKACELFNLAHEQVFNSPFDQIFQMTENNNENYSAQKKLEPNHKTNFDVKSLKSNLEITCNVIRKNNSIEIDSMTGEIYIFEPISESLHERELDSINQNVIDIISAQVSKKNEIRELVPGFVAQSPIMHKIFSLISKVAKTDASVLVTGESGTGKELVARSIHDLSERANAKFVAINCAAIPEHLLESEFFGHKKGAFTGAYQDRLGLFEIANCGTIFLDEIGELPLHLQSKLLRVLQEKTFRPIGSNVEHNLNVRIIAATNRSLHKEVASEKFREDLYYRINVVSIALPPLRERKEDIPILIESIFNKLNLKVDDLNLTKDNLNILMSYNYPGNVRELENIIERALVMGDGKLNLDFLQFGKLNTSENFETKIITLDQVNLPVELDQLLAQLERNCIEQALSQAEGIKVKAAELLGMNLRSFRYRLEKFEMKDE